jgi:hypothetical protein
MDAHGFLTLVVAIVGAGIALGQYTLARMRMKHDLYDRRYRIFQASRLFIAEVCQQGSATYDQVLSHHRDTGDAIFLLNRKVVGYLSDLEKHGRRLAFLRRVIENDHNPNRDATIDEKAEILQWFTEQFDPLIKQLKPFLQLERSPAERWAAFRSRPESF